MRANSPPSQRGGSPRCCVVTSLPREELSKMERWLPLAASPGEYSNLIEFCLLEQNSPSARGLDASVETLFSKSVLCDFGTAPDSTPGALGG